MSEHFNSNENLLVPDVDETLAFHEADLAERDAVDERFSELIEEIDETVSSEKERKLEIRAGSKSSDPNESPSQEWEHGDNE